MSSLKTWIGALRLRTLPLAISSIVVGGAFGMHLNDVESYLLPHSTPPKTDAGMLLGLAVLTAILLQILSNLANDYGDYKKGTDNDDRLGPERALQSGNIAPKSMLIAVVITAVLSLLSGLCLLYLSFGDEFESMAWFFALGMGAIAAAIKYTMGKNPYGYKAMGDVFVFIFFGPVAVLGTFFLLTHNLTNVVFFPGIAFGLFSIAVLNLNNMRDIHNDRASGKITIPVRIGLENARSIYHPGIIILGWLFMIITFVAVDIDSMLLIFLPTFVYIRNIKFSYLNEIPQKFNPELKKIALATFFLSIMVWLGLAIDYNISLF